MNPLLSQMMNNQMGKQFGDQNPENENIEKLRKKFEELNLPEETKLIVEKELKNLSRIWP